MSDIQVCAVYTLRIMCGGWCSTNYHYHNHFSNCKHSFLYSDIRFIHSMYSVVYSYLNSSVWRTRQLIKLLFHCQRIFNLISIDIWVTIANVSRVDLRSDIPEVKQLKIWLKFLLKTLTKYDSSMCCGMSFLLLFLIMYFFV